jgi:hypothetical protein
MCGHFLNEKPENASQYRSALFVPFEPRKRGMACVLASAGDFSACDRPLVEEFHAEDQ